MNPYKILVSLALLFSVVSSFMMSKGIIITKEGGLVENLTVVLYGVLLLAILVFVKRKEKFDRLLWGIIVSCLMFRELDFDKKFTTMGVFKSNFYKSSEVPMMEKFFAVCFIVAILVVIAVSLKGHWSTLIEGVKASMPAQCGIAAAVGLAAFSKLVLDGLPRKLEDLRIPINDLVLDYHGVFEELLELAIPIALLMSLYYGRTALNIKR